MSKSRIHLGEGLDPALVVQHSTGLPSATQAFLDAKLLILDNVPWPAHIEVIQTALSPKKRAFKDPFIERPPSPAVTKQIGNVIAHANKLFAQLYPTFVSVEVRTSFRPMITGPEPLHFDTYGGEAPLVTAYINVSDEPREYGIGPNFPTLMLTHPDLLRRLKANGAIDVSYPLRQMGQKGEGPFGPLAPRHRVELAPGAIWFFNAKTVSHEVVYGRGAIGISWEVPACGAKMQADYLKEL